MVLLWSCCIHCRTQVAAHTSMCAMPSGGPSFEAHLLPPLLPRWLCSVARGDLHPEWSRAWSAQRFQGTHPLTLLSLAPPLARPVKPKVSCMVCPMHPWHTLTDTVAPGTTTCKPCQAQQSRAWSAQCLQGMHSLTLLPLEGTFNSLVLILLPRV